MSGHYERKKQKKPLGWKKIVLIVLAVILALVLALIIAGVVYYHSMLGKIKHVDVPKVVYTEAPTETVENVVETTQAETTEATTVPTTEPHVASSADYINVLLVGQSAREGEESRMADTMILATINTYTKTVTLTSFLRDSFVKMPDYKGHTGGRIKLTTIYNLGSVYGDGVAGSMELMNMTLYNNFGIEVDYNFEIDFEAFVKAVDLLDGVELELTEAEAKYLNDDDIWVYYDVEPGLTRLDGMMALSFVRMRKAEGDNESDIIRTSRQRRFLEALFAKLKTKSLSRLQSIANEVLPMVYTSMTNSEITDLLLKLLPMLPELQMEAGGTCPADYWGDMVDIYSDGFPHSVLRFDEAATKKTMRALTEGEEP